MRDLQPKKLNNAKGVSRNRLRRAKKERKPVDLRPYIRKGVRGIVILTVVLGGAFLAWEGWRLLSSAVFFRIERIEVAGNRRLDRREILSYAGVKEGAGMLRLDLARIGEHLEKNPWIESVAIRRYFPHTLRIQVAERDPVAIVNMGYLYYADRKGEVFKPLNDGDRLDYPVVTGIAEEDLAKDPSGTKGALKAAGDLIDRLRASATDFGLDDVSEIHYDKGFGFTLFTMQGGVPVRVGMDGFPEKLERLAKIYRDLRTQMTGLEYIDINYGDKIVVKKT
jgi:cell division protein FtsQ